MRRLAILAAGWLVVLGLAGPARAHHPSHGAVVVRTPAPVTVVVGPRLHPAPRVIAPGFVHAFPHRGHVVHGPVIHPHPFPPFVFHPGTVVVVRPGKVLVPVSPVWVPGFWRWDGFRWIWVAAHWSWW